MKGCWGLGDPEGEMGVPGGKLRGKQGFSRRECEESPEGLGGGDGGKWGSRVMGGLVREAMGGFGGV